MVKESYLNIFAKRRLGADADADDVFLIFLMSIELSIILNNGKNCSAALSCRDLDTADG